VTDTAFAGLIDLAAGAMVLAAVLIVWRRDLASIIRLLAWQGAALAAIPIIRGVHEGDAALVGIGVLIAALRVVGLPWLLARAMGPRNADRGRPPRW
jgi:hydrogenase-4 component E